MKKKGTAAAVLVLCAALMTGSPAWAQEVPGQEQETETEGQTEQTETETEKESQTEQTETETESQTKQTEQTSAGDEGKKAARKVTVTGLNRKISKAVSSKAVIRDVIKISPVRNCRVRLRIYDKANKKWKTVKSYKLKKGSSGRLKITYPSDWKKTRSSKWSLYISASGSYAAYKSKTVTITSSRPVKPKLKLGSRSAVIIRSSDKYVIYSKRRNKRLANASTTKMVTALLTIERGKLSGNTKISKRAAATGWGCLGAKAGTKFKVRDLLNVMLIHSSNDAASALAEYNAGTIENFADKMNKRVRKLGCKNTHFVNPHGLDNKNHYSSAYDLALIQRECIRHKTYRDIIKKKRYSFRTVGKPRTSYTFYSTDALLGSINGFQGGKTGTTGQAGKCFCGVYRYKGVTYIFTVLGNSSDAGRWSDSRKIIKFIRNNYK